MFNKARKNLTLSYLAIVAIISITVSWIIYREVENTAKKELIKQDLFIEKRFKRVILNDGKIRDDMLQSDKTLIEIRKNTVISLGLLNLFILFVTSILGYWFAGKTLKPIQDNDKKQKEFLANASHELKTPLTSLKTQMEVAIRDNNISIEEAKEILKSGVEDINYLNKIVSNFLTIGKLQENQQKINVVSIDLKSALDETVLRYKDRILDRKIIIENKVKETSIKADEFLIKELFGILIDNSIKYLKPYGLITIFIEKHKDFYLITFKDNGLGISKEDLPHIFDRFYKSDKSRNRLDTEGSGLGLTIAREIMFKHKGYIVCKSEIGKYTTFYLKFPIIR
jgi:signal transduction histidine kinase